MARQVPGSEKGATSSQPSSRQPANRLVRATECANEIPAPPEAQTMTLSSTGLLKTRRLWPLAVAQSCGALNDNLVKNAMIVLAIFSLGIGGAGLSALAGALFIAPYILLSATAGKLADRFSKPRVILAYKLAEVVLMAA